MRAFASPQPSILVASVCLILVGANACSDGARILDPSANDALSQSGTRDTGTLAGGDPVGELNPSVRPANTMRALMRAYNHRDRDLFEQLFDPEDFSFRFDPLDLQENPDLPVSWSWPEEWTATRNMFDSDDVLDIRLDYQLGPVLEVEEDDVVPLDWMKMTVTDVHLELEWQPADGGDPVVFFVDGDRGQFFFKPVEVSGRTTWPIAEWRDIRVGAAGAATEDRSWGYLKSLFR